MDIKQREKLRIFFNEEVVVKFNLYKSLLLALPYQGLESYGGLLSFFSRSIKPAQKKGMNSVEIVESFFTRHMPDASEVERQSILFKFIQFVEREVALFDAIEDSTFPLFLKKMPPPALTQLLNEVERKKLETKLAEVVNYFRYRIVLTAHPTQFYPPRVLRIMEDLRMAISKSDISEVNLLLKQLGKTAFRSKKKPTPLDEAISIISTLEETLFDVIPDLEKSINQVHSKASFQQPAANGTNGSEAAISCIHNFQPIVELGFWPGGDRDGNPFVTASVTEKVAAQLKHAVVGCYLATMRRLLRRLTFAGVYDRLLEVQEKLKNISLHKGGYKNCDDFLAELLEIEQVLLKEHNGIFKNYLEKLLFSVSCFGFHFASLDLREDSRIHHKAATAIFAFLCQQCKENKLPISATSAKLFAGYEQQEEGARIKTLTRAIEFLQKEKTIAHENGTSFLLVLEADLQAAKAAGEKHSLAAAIATCETIFASFRIQKSNGVRSLHRYIISNTQKASNVLELYFMLQLLSPTPFLIFDVVPLFETIADLNVSEEIMRKLFSIPVYKKHLETRKNSQVIMLGYSDGTKDGGYVASNWTIFHTKTVLSKIAEAMDVSIVFFDGRGGPPSRGGGDTRNFYKALPSEINNREIQLTIQGQTISANFSTKKKAIYNISETLSAGLENAMGVDDMQQLTKDEKKLFEHMVEVSKNKYLNFKKHEDFMSYLETISPLRFYGDSNIASRPTKRNVKSKLKLEDLRAIPFVSSWSQIKQIVPAFYGLGSALQSAYNTFPQIDLAKLYKESLFFKSMLENSMQSLLKTNLKFTQKFVGYEKFKNFRSLIVAEEYLTRKWLSAIVENRVAEVFPKDASKFATETKDEDVIISTEDELEIANNIVAISRSYLKDTPLGRRSIEMRQKIIRPLLLVQQYALSKLRQNNISLQQKNTYEKVVVRSMIGAVNASRNSA